MKRNGKKARKIRKLIVTCVLSAVVLVVSTYTWFIGIQTVHVNPFQIEIAATEGLFLSLDGSTWSYELDVMNAAAYANNTNQLQNVELVPMSTVGDLDPTSATMKLYEKASLTTSPGGYRLLASRVNNNTASTITIGEGDDAVTKTLYKEQNGYIAFDLFIKNLSGNAYYTDNQPLNEEAIYLNFDSAVSVDTTGAADQALTGIENSVRVAFTQIGRVNATTTTVDTITGLTCNIDTDEDSDTFGKPIYTSATGVTGICRNAQIWEPNDTKHAANAINWYDASCLTRKADGDTINLPASYNVNTNTSGASNAVKCYDNTNTNNTKKYMAANGNALPTYAISNEIVVDDHVDVYDGLVLNTYEKNTAKYTNIVENVEKGYKAATESTTPKRSEYKLVEFPYFTDTMKDLKGMARPEFMTLAPNSITKVRVYVWLEGQDIDNYDFAQLGKTIKVNFGFTKERFLDTDVKYDSENSPMTREDNGITTTIPTTSEIAG